MLGFFSSFSWVLETALEKVRQWTRGLQGEQWPGENKSCVEDCLEDLDGAGFSGKTSLKKQSPSHRLQVECMFSGLRMCQRGLVVELEVFRAKGTSEIMDERWASKGNITKEFRITTKKKTLTESYRTKTDLDGSQNERKLMDREKLMISEGGERKDGVRVPEWLERWEVMLKKYDEWVSYFMGVTQTRRHGADGWDSGGRRHWTEGVRGT